MTVINTIELAQELQARTSFSQQDAIGIVQTIARALDATTSNLVTRDQFDVRFAERRTEIAELRAEFKSDIAEPRTKLRTEMAELRTQLRSKVAGLRAEIAGVRAESRADIASARTGIASLLVEMHQAFRAQSVWMTSTMVAVAAVVVAAFKLF